MLIPFPEVLSRYNVRPVGVMHIGASWGQESEAYFNNGVKNVLFIEAIPEVFGRLQKHVARFPFESVICINACITDVDGEEKDFKISSNDGESSSIYDFGFHSQMHPDVTWVDEITLTSNRMDTLIRSKNVDIAKYDFLNVDLQGADLLAIKSLGNHLNQFKTAYIEVNNTDIYKSCAQVGEVDAYMSKYGFRRAETKWINDSWGDAVYIKL